MSMFSIPLDQYISLWTMAAFGLLQLIIVLLFWYCHLRHHRNHPIYRIRHPIFWTVCMCVASFQITWKAIITYLRIRYIISENVYQILNHIGVLLIGLGCVFARGFVLWFTVKFQQHQENQLFEQVLVSEDDDDDEYQHKLYRNTTLMYRYEKYLSNPMRVFVSLECIYLFLTLIGGALIFFVNRSVAKYYLIAIVVLIWAILGLFIFAIWSNGYRIKYNANGNEEEMSTRFTDHFNFRWEVTIIWIDVFIFVPLRSWCAIKFKVEDANTSHAGLVFIAFLTLLSQLFPVIAQIVVPFWTYLNRKQSRSVFRDSSNDVTVFDVMSDKHGFFLFVNHAVQELNLENVSCLIAIYQFKHLKTSRDQLLKPVTKSNVERNGEPSDIEVGLLSNTTPMVRQYCLKLIALPWKYLPLTKSLSNIMDTKYVQAQKIYHSFFKSGGLNTVNISGAARDYVDSKFMTLQKMVEKEKDIERDRVFQDDLLKVFDMALPDLCSNLTDMMHRFRATKEYKTLSIA